MKQVIYVVVCVAFVCGTAWETRGQGDMFAEEVSVSRNRAVMLSMAFPGLGQMASGQKLKGGTFFLSELVALIVAVDAHESYKTRENVYESSRREYAALRVGGSYSEAEVKWQRLEERDDDLDTLHRRRQIFGYAVAGIYALNVIDILLSHSESGTTAHKTDHRPLLSIGLVGGSTGIVVSRGF